MALPPPRLLAFLQLVLLLWLLLHHSPHDRSGCSSSCNRRAGGTQRGAQWSYRHGDNPPGAAFKPCSNAIHTPLSTCARNCRLCIAPRWRLDLFTLSFMFRLHVSYSAAINRDI